MHNTFDISLKPTLEFYASYIISYYFQKLRVKMYHGLQFLIIQEQFIDEIGKKDFSHRKCTI